MSGQAAEFMESVWCVRRGCTLCETEHMDAGTEQETVRFDHVAMYMTTGSMHDQSVGCKVSSEDEAGALVVPSAFQGTHYLGRSHVTRTKDGRIMAWDASLSLRCIATAAVRCGAPARRIAAAGNMTQCRSCDYNSRQAGGAIETRWG